MAQRPSDASLASNFTRTKHTQPSASLAPSSTNPLPDGLHILIIGASRGIGASIAHAYAQSGAATLMLAARASSSHELDSVAQTCRSACIPACRTVVSTHEVDIASAPSVARLAQRVRDQVSRLDVVVLNSGYSGPVVLKMDEGHARDFSDVLDVNVKGTYLVAHYLVPVLLAPAPGEQQKKGEKGERSEGAKTFIAVGSLAACIVNGHIANTAYCVSKFAQARLVQFLAEQYRHEGLLAVAVHPGAVNTEMADKTTPESFRPYLTDDVTLCGAFCVWLSREKRMWLNGRLVCATWDVDELMAKKDDIESQDLLKFGFRVGNV